MDELLEEVRRLAADGVVEVTLLGQNVNSYGRDLTRRRPMFAELLSAVGAVEGIRRVRFTSPHPKDLRPKPSRRWPTPRRLTPHLHLPLQSGSDRVLAVMRRGYTAQRYLERLAAARAAIDDLAVTTDLIVGFPGETEDDFDQTLAVVAEAAYDSTYTFIFSPRRGPGRRPWRPTTSNPPWSPTASSGCVRWWSARHSSDTKAAHRAHRRGARRRAEPARPRRAHRPERPGQARALRAGRGPAHPGGLVRTRLGHRGCAAPPEWRPARVTAAPRHRTRIPVSAA